MHIVLLTDFGTADYFVGAMKGAILSVNAEARIFDLTHEIPPQDIRAGAFTLLASYKTFPAGTIFVCVVDPGVGSERRPILIKCRDYYFIGPDNGLFTDIFEREEACRVFHLTNEKYFRQPRSETFHGRDIFAPVAGALSTGIEPAELGVETVEWLRLESTSPRRISERRVEAQIIHIDRFGNCITNITREVLTEEISNAGAKLDVGGHAIQSFRKYFAAHDAGELEVFAVWGSAGFLEIAAYCASAADLLGAVRGQIVSLSWDESDEV